MIETRFYKTLIINKPAVIDGIVHTFIFYTFVAERQHDAKNKLKSEC
jgi:hypothetical protein